MNNGGLSVLTHNNQLHIKSLTLCTLFFGTQSLPDMNAKASSNKTKDIFFMKKKNKEKDNSTPLHKPFLLDSQGIENVIVAYRLLVFSEMQFL